MSLSNPVFARNKSKSTNPRTPLKQFDFENVRRSPRKKKDVVDKGRRKLDFQKDNRKGVKDRLKGLVAYVDACPKQDEIKQRIINLGGQIEDFLDKNVRLIITNQKPQEKSDGRVAENSPLSGTGPSPLPQHKP